MPILGHGYTESKAVPNSLCSVGESHSRAGFLIQSCRGDQSPGYCSAVKPPVVLIIVKNADQWPLLFYSLRRNIDIDI
jgi:hypothetical protein